MNKKKNSLVEVWEPTKPWEICELTESEKSEVDGEIFLAKIRGPFFVPDGHSRNKRYYPSELWEKVLGDARIQERLGGRVMFGTIGHDDRPVSEEDLAKGLVSHVVTKLWIDDENNGMGEALVYSTSAGRNLYTYMKGKSLLKTSSRATGGFVKGETKDGAPIVDKDSYYLETFDFVINPGFVETDPQLIEGLQKEERTIMNVEAMVEKLQSSRDRLQGEVVQAQEGLKAANEKLAAVTAERDTLKESEGITALAAKLGLTESVLEDLQKTATLLGVAPPVNLLHKLGKFTPEGLELAQDLELPEKMKKLEAFLDISASPTALAAEIDEAKTALAAYQEIGTPEEINTKIDQAAEVLEAYTELGTVEELEALRAEAASASEELATSERERAIEEIASQTGLNVEDIEETLDEMGGDLEKTRKMITKLTGTKLTESATDDDLDTKPAPLAESGATRFFQSVSGPRA